MEETEGIYWCNSHQREATHEDPFGAKCCDPKLGGILLPCIVVHIMAEIIEDENE